jgi:hypothetical protein
LRRTFEPLAALALSAFALGFGKTVDDVKRERTIAAVTEKAPGKP